MPFTPEPTASGRWRGGFLHPVTGKKPHKTFDYFHEAEAWAIVEEQRARAAMLEDVEIADTTALPRRAAKVVKLNPGPTLSSYGRDYLDRRHGLLAKATRDKYRSAYNGLHLPYGTTGVFADRPAFMIRKRDVEQWMTDQVEAGTGPDTVNARLGFVRRLYTDMLANRTEGIDTDPTAGVELLTTGIVEDRVLTIDEDHALLDAADPLHRVAFLVALDAGFRWQEVYALRTRNLRRNVDGGIDYLTITGVCEKDSGIIRPWPKGKRPRKPVPTTERLSAALAELVEDTRPEDLLFPTAKGGVWLYSNHRRRIWAPTLYEIGEAERVSKPTKRIRKYGPNAGQPYEQVRFEANFGFHQLRHTYGSRLSAANVPRAEIADLMGHADERTTKRYIHTGDDGRRLSLVRESLTA